MSASLYMCNTSLEERVAKCAALRAENAVPLVVERAGACDGKAHFTAVPRDTTVAQLEAAVRGFAGGKKAVALVVSGCNPSATATLGDLQDACAEQDGLLYVAYGAEKAMGGCGVNSAYGDCAC